MNDAKRESRKRYYWAHREEQLAATRKWFANLRNRPELHARRLAKKREYYWKNRERMVARAREYHRRYPMMRKLQYMSMMERFEHDAAAYAEYREKADALAMQRLSRDRYTPGYFLHSMPMRGFEIEKQEGGES